MVALLFFILPPLLQEKPAEGREPKDPRTKMRRDWLYAAFPRGIDLGPPSPRRGAPSRCVNVRRSIFFTAHVFIICSRIRGRSSRIRRRCSRIKRRSTRACSQPVRGPPRASKLDVKSEAKSKRICQTWATQTSFQTAPKQVIKTDRF